MAVQSGIKIEGMEELNKVLNEMAPRASRNLMRSTIHGVASTIAKQAKKNAPRDTGTLRKAIKAKRRRPKNPDVPYSDVMVEHGRDARNDAWYWHFVEFGTGGQNPQPEHPFIRPAIDEMRGQVPQIMREQFGKKLEGMLDRAAKKQKKAGG